MPQMENLGQNSNQKAEFGNSLDLVDIKEIRDNVVLMKDGSLKHIIMVGGVNFALKSETEQNIIIEGYQNLLNGVDFPLQIVVHSRKVNIDRYAQSLLDRKDKEESPLLKSQIDEYVEFIKGFVQKNAIMEKVFLVVVPFYPVGLGFAKKGKGILPMFGSGKKTPAKTPTSGASSPAGTTAPDPEAEKDFRENVAQLGQRSGQIINSLLNIGLEAALLENDALIELFYNFYNPQTVEREDISIPEAAAR